MRLGGVSARTGRKPPMIGGLVALAAATLLFAFADSLRWLFAARLVQGAADAVTWVVGFALLADLYRPEERGRIMGVVMGGTSVSFMIGPSLGGWLYEMGGIRLPFLAVAGMAVAGAAAFGCLAISRERTSAEHVPIAAVVREPAIARCTLTVIAASATLSMFEPVFVLHLQMGVGLGPARVGLVFGAAALA